MSTPVLAPGWWCLYSTYPSLGAWEESEPPPRTYHIKMVYSDVKVYIKCYD